MSANVLIQTGAFAGFKRAGLGGHLASMPRGLRGLSATDVNFTDEEGLTITADPKARTEVSYADWVSNVDAQWAAANPAAAQALKTKLMAANLGGIGLLVGGAIAFALGQKAIGIGMGVLGAGGIAYSAIATKTEVVGSSILKVGG